MPDPDYQQRRTLATMPRERLEAHQLRRLNELLATVLPGNRFYADKLSGVELPLQSLSQLNDLPAVTKEELSAACQADSGALLTYDTARYTRFHQTSGTRGAPITVWDTPHDWDWWVQTWQYVLDAAQVTQRDRALMAFSFGPFIGFWSAHDAIQYRGALTIPAGGLSTARRLELITSSRATVVCCTPSYALRMAEVASQQHIHLQESDVRVLIVAGEPGGSLPAVRQRISQAWNADVIDHSGATEVGPWGFSSECRTGLHIIESEFIAEFLPQGNHKAVCELVLTTLGRTGWPSIRYRTGDLVRCDSQAQAIDGFVLLPGGVVGRIDDMITIRGVNVFPTAIENILRMFPSVQEYRLTVFQQSAMDELKIELEDPAENVAAGIADALQQQLGIRIQVETCDSGTLPRFEAKATRLVDLREQ